ncbi:hypothetical protein BKM35_22035 [Salmonella enterica]|nr:hypothetical protein [Salmonella enterica]
MSDTKNTQIPEEIIELAKKLGEKLGVKVDVAQMSKGLADLESILPRVIVDMYLMASLITDVTDVEKPGEMEFLKIVALSQGMMRIAEEGMPQGFFERVLSHEAFRQRKSEFMNVASSMVEDALKDDCDCPKCQARRAEKEDSKHTVH